MSVLTLGMDTQLGNPVLARFSRLAHLSPHEADILGSLSARARRYPAGAELCHEGQVQPPSMLLSGWACYQSVLGDGRRQIVQFLLPGDAVGSLSRPELPASCTAVALTPVQVADGRPLLREADERGVPFSGLAEAIAAVSQADAVILCDQVVRLGRQTAYERLLHLLLELQGRLDAVGMVDENSFPVPLTQEILADALGLSVVHVNRTLQQVRRDRLLDMRGGRVTLHRRDTMQSLAEGTGLPM